MKIIKTIFIFAVIFNFNVNLLLAQNKNDNSKIEPMEIISEKEPGFVLGGKKFTIKDVILHLIEKNEDIQNLLYDAAMADSNYLKFQKKYSPFLQLGGSAKKTEWPDDIVAFNGDEQKEYGASAALSKGFSTGTVLSAGFQHTYADNIDKNPQFGDVKYHQPVFYVSLQQELLKNFMGYNDRRQNEILKNSDVMIKEISAYQVSSVVIGAIIDTWNLALKASEVSNARLKLKETKKVRRIISSNVSLGLNEKFDLNYWNSLVAMNEAQEASAEFNFNEIERKVRIDFNVSDEISVNEKTILSNVLPEIKLETALSKAYLNRADYKNALLSLKNSKMQLEIYRNEALPSLTGALTMSSMGERDELNDAMNDAIAIKDRSYEATIQMTYPLDDSEQKANARDALMKYKQSLLNLSKIKKNVKSDVENSIDAIKTAYIGYVKAKRARIESERYYLRLRSYLKRGRFSAAVVKNALDAMVDSRQNELGALINYNAALMRYDISQNQLFEKNEINIYKIIDEKRKSQN